MYSINYLGINSTLIKERENIENFRKNMKIYNALSICKFVLFFVNFVGFIIILYILNVDKNLVEFIYSIIMTVITIIYIIISIICLIINLKYIHSIMNKINKDFERKKKGYGYNILIIVYGFFLLSNYIIIIIYSLIKGKFCVRRNNDEPSVRSNPSINVENTNPNIQGIVDGESQYPINQVNNQDNNLNIQISINNMNIIHPIEDNNVNNKHPIKDNNLNNKNTDNKNVSKSYKPNIKFLKGFEPIKKETVILEKKNCVICESNPSKIIISPCGHRCLCQDCYTSHKDKITQCPICRAIVKDFLEKIYDV